MVALDINGHIQSINIKIINLLIGLRVSLVTWNVPVSRSVYIGLVVSSICITPRVVLEALQNLEVECMT